MAVLPLALCPDRLTLYERALQECFKGHRSGGQRIAPVYDLTSPLNSSWTDSSAYRLLLAESPEREILKLFSQAKEGKQMSKAFRIGNFSGYEADRWSALRDVLTGDPVDVVFGDYLAEITLASLVTRLDKDASRGYVAKFFEQFKDCFDILRSRGTRIVTNAGGFDPRALAEDIHEFAASRGTELSVAYVLGDNLLDRFPDLVASGYTFTNMDTGKEIEGADTIKPISVNAYLGGWGIAKALAEGAQVVKLPLDRGHLETGT
ncbi:acyclic terpene utilization AtuA family protein [Streptomyces kronopolitis]